jgi:hypothetical protein
MRVFLDEVNIFLSDLVKQMTLPPGGCASSNQLKDLIEQKTNSPASRGRKTDCTSDLSMLSDLN